MVQPEDAFRQLTRARSQVRVREGELERLVVEYLEAGASHVTGRLQLRTYQILTTETPVDKGTARSGWTPGRMPQRDPITAPKDDDQARSAASARFAANQAEAERIARRYRVRQGPTFISNPVPWIVPLNAGSSAQAASMFVERALETAVRTINL